MSERECRLRHFVAQIQALAVYDCGEVKIPAQKFEELLAELEGCK